MSRGTPAAPATDPARVFAAHRRETVVARSPWRMPQLAGPDGLWRRRASVLERLLHHGEHAVMTRVAQTPQGVVIGAWSDDEGAAAWAVGRIRWVLGLDDDLSDFHRRFSEDPWIGRAIRADPGRRLRRAPEPFQALAWAVTEQLIEYERAAAIQRRLIARFGRRCERTGMVDAPSAQALAALAPAQLQACDLSAGRARALIAAAREVASGRVDLQAQDHERGWERLRALRGIGAWTLEMLAIHGQGRFDQLPAADLHLLDLTGRVLTGEPRARATEAQVRALFAPYSPWGAMAMIYASAKPRQVHRAREIRSPGRGGTRSSAQPRRPAAA